MGIEWVVVLVRSAGPTNVGLTARACANLGIEDLRLVNPICDITCKEARMFANKAGHLLQDAVYDDLAAAIADCDGVLASSARPRDPAYGPPLSVDQMTPWAVDHGVRRCAILFGNEANGLSDEELRHAQAVWRLATPGTYDNYNLSHAVAITLHELQTAGVAAIHPSEDSPQPSPHPTISQAPSAAEREALLRYWLGTLDRVNFFVKSDRTSWQPHFERLIRRLPLGEQDVRVLRAGLAQFNRHAFGDKADIMAKTGFAPASTDKTE